MFVDEARIFVRSGRGGDGAVTFRREKYVPRGGPSGGDGGDGGSVILEVDEGLRTLLDFKYRQHFSAENGRPGGPSKRSGARGRDLVVPVPPGTVVWDVTGGERRLLADLTEPGQRFIVARGGRGGRGNARFATSTERAPTFAEKGEPGRALTLVLELKLLADAGLVGMPNAGKSTFLSRVSAARPKVADYPFTTLAPNLGVVAVPGRPEASFVLADIPGLVEGAHAGSGLGDRFLRHVERTKILVHLVDVSPLSGRDPVGDYLTVRGELGLYDPSLAEKPEIVVATKIDVDGAEERARRLEDHLRRRSHAEKVYRASPLTGEGLDRVLHAVADELSRAAVESRRQMGAADRGAPEPAPEEAQAERRSFTVTRQGGVFVVSGEDVERMVVMTDLEHEAAVRRLHHRLRRRGVIRALREAGAGPGDTVRIAGFEFDFTE